MSDKDTTITADALKQMLDQFKQSTNLRKLASSYLDQAQAFEDAIYPLLAERGIDNATGDRLDGIGAILGIPRSGRTDTAYRFDLNIEILVLKSRGTEAELVELVKFAITSTGTVEFIENFPKGVVIRPVNDPVNEADSIDAGRALRRAVSAGTTAFVVTSVRSDTLIYTLSSQAATLETSSSLGLANDAQTTGGYMSYAY